MIQYIVYVLVYLIFIGACVKIFNFFGAWSAIGLFIIVNLILLHFITKTKKQ